MRRPATGCDGRPVTTSSTPFAHTAGSRGPAALRLARRLLRSAYWSLSDFGWVWIGPMPSPSGPDPAGEIPPGHPERLTDLPLTPLERALERELTG
ncbi:hypothetical protein SAMN05428944_8008 [Streptomyces sp. 1222.5]|nr:hypothetical protein BX260_8017 [Streptomyces sp. 5112.2]SED86075.1 hypothetical protein SAMN05428944_8008 [Streptomyces sp. 1222.5]